MSLAAGLQKMVGLGMANMLSIHQLQNGQQLSGRNGATASVMKTGAYMKAGEVRALGSEQQTSGLLLGVPRGQASRSKVVHGEWPSCSFPFDQAQEEQATTIHRLLHSAINNVDPNATGIVLDGTFYPFSAKCTPFQPGRGFLLPPKVDVRWDDSMPFPQKPVEQRVLVYYPAEKRVRWEAYTDDRKQVEGTALLVESRTFTLQLEKELCIKYEMRLSQDVLNFMQAESSPMLISHSVRPFRMRASTFQSPEVALSVSSAGALHPDSTWQSRNGALADGRLTRLSGTPPLEPSNAKAISNLFLFHRRLHWPERAPPEAPLQTTAMRDVKAPLLSGAAGAAPALNMKPGMTTAIMGRDRTLPLQVSQTLARLQNGRTAVPQAQVILQPGISAARRHGVADANGVRLGNEGLGRPPSSHSQRTESEGGLRGSKGLNNFSFSTPADLTSWAPALSKAVETVRLGGQEKPRGVVPPPNGGTHNRGSMLGYTMDKISRLTPQQQSLLLQQHMLQQRQMAQPQPPPPPAPLKPIHGHSCLPYGMIPTPGYVSPQLEQPPMPAPPVSQPEHGKKVVKGKSRAKKQKQDATLGPRPLSPASSAANSSAGSPPLASSSALRNPSPVTLPSAAYDQNIPIAQLYKANRKKQKNELVSGGSSPTGSRDSHKQIQRPLQRTASTISGGSFLSGLSNPGATNASPPIPEAVSPRSTMIPTPGLSFLGPNRPSSSQGLGALPFLPTDATSTGSLLDSPRYSNVLTGRGQNGFFAAAARSSDSFQGVGGASLGGRGVSLGAEPSFGGMQMIPTPGMMPTPGLHSRGRSWEPNADLLSDLQSTGTEGVAPGEVALLEQWPQQPGSFMDMLTEDAGVGDQADGEAGGEEAADASADPFKEVLDSLDLSLFQEEGGLTPSEQEGGSSALLQQRSAALMNASLSGQDRSRGGMEMQVQDRGNGTLWQGVVQQPVMFGAVPVGGAAGCSVGSTGLDLRMKGATLGAGGSHLQPPMNQTIQQPHANSGFGGWNSGTCEEGYGMEGGAAYAVRESGASPGQAQVDSLGLDSNGDPGLSGALDELMELDADFLDINIDDGTLFEGGIGPGDWSDLGGF